MVQTGPHLRDTAHSMSHTQEPAPTGFNNKRTSLLHVMRDLASVASGVAGSSAQLMPQESVSFYRPIIIPLWYKLQSLHGDKMARADSGSHPLTQ